MYEINKQTKKNIAFKQLSFKIKVFFNLDNIDTKKYQYYNKTKCLLTGLRRNCQRVNRKHRESLLSLSKLYSS